MVRLDPVLPLDLSMKRLFCLPPLLLLAACADVPEDSGPVTVGAPAPASTGFGGIETLERPSAEFEVLVACLSPEERALVGQPVSTARAMMPGARFIGPDELFTQDYQPTRSNVDYNAAGAVTRVWCG